MNPNTAIATQKETRVSSDACDTDHCLHCGQPAIYRIKLDADSIAFCCVGCEAVYKFLKAQKLSRYYDLLNKIDSKGPTQNEHIHSNSGRFDQSAEIDPVSFKYGTTGAYAIYYPSFNCAACLWLVDKVLKDIAAIKSYRVHLEDHLLIIFTEDFQAKNVISHTLSRLYAAGYKGFPPHYEQKNLAGQDLLRKKLIHLGIAGAIFANVMLLSSSVYFIDYFSSKDDIRFFFNAVSCVLTLVSMSTAGRVFFKNTLLSLRAHILHIDAPIIAATSVAWILSCYHMLRGDAGVYFDSITGLIFFLLLSRYLSDALTAKAKKFMGVTAQSFASPSQHIVVGSIISVDQGMTIPADGVIENGRAEIAESFLTGESTLKVKTKGESVFAGSLNFGAPFQMRVASVGETTWIAKTASLLEQVTEKKDQIEQTTGVIAKWFSVATVSFAILAFVLWHEHGFATTLEVICSVLIVSCPCALAMGVPLANALAFRRLWKEGIIVRNRDVLSRAQSLDTIVFDKTGTLTEGHLEVLDVLTADADIHPLLGYVHCATNGSKHPVGRAVHLWSQQFPLAEIQQTSCKIHPGQGSEYVGKRTQEGVEESLQIYVGSLAWIKTRTTTLRTFTFIQETEQRSCDDSRCGILIHHAANDSHSEYALALTLRDRARLDASEVVAKARSKGMKVVLLSGDQKGPAQKLGLTLGFREAEIMAEQLPSDKIAFIQHLSSLGHSVMMVGDGFNDAAALKSADVGIAVTGGVDATNQVSDAFLTSDRLGGVLQLIEYATYHHRTLWLTLSASVAYNLVAISLALTNHIHPLTAALIMPLSSLTVLCGVWLRNGGGIWKSSTSSCRLP